MHRRSGALRIRKSCAEERCVGTRHLGQGYRSVVVASRGPCGTLAYNRARQVMRSPSSVTGRLVAPRILATACWRRWGRSPSQHRQHGAGEDSLERPQPGDNEHAHRNVMARHRTKPRCIETHRTGLHSARVLGRHKHRSPAVLANTWSILRRGRCRPLGQVSSRVDIVARPPWMHQT